MSCTAAVAKDNTTHARAIGNPAGRPLIPLLGELLLVVIRIGHGEGEAVNELGVQAVEQPGTVGLAFEPPGGLNRKAAQGFKVQLGPGATVVAGVAGGHRPADLLHVGGDVSDGRGAGGALAVFQGLGEEGPQDDGRGEGGVGGEKGVAFGERLLDIGRGQRVGERQAGLIEERCGDLVKAGLAGLEQTC